MRKIIAILVGLLMLFSIPALGEEIDFSTMDIDSLLVIRDRAQQEIALRTDENIVIWSIQLGEYVCGEHIKAGNYTFTNPDTTEKYRRIVVFENQEKLKSWDQLHQFNLEPNQSAFIELKDGMILGIYDGSLLIEEASIPFAP